MKIDANTQGRLLTIALEQRILLDGALVATHTEASEAIRPEVSIDVATEQTTNNNEADILENLSLAYQGRSEKNEIAFVDPSVEGVQDHIENIGAFVDVVVLDPAKSGLEQISASLEKYQNLDAIHIISHGDNGHITLGNETVSTDDLNAKYADVLTEIGSKLHETGDILLYGCDVTGNDEGKFFVNTLSELTGADVAASEDTTGAASQGGDWDLETEVGSIESESIEADAWTGVLTTSNTGAWSISTSGNDATASNTVSGITTTIQMDAVDANTSFTAGSGVSNGSFNTIPVFTPPSVEGSDSLVVGFAWDTSPEGGGDAASDDGGSATITVTFSETVIDPILHLDRIGGAGGGLINGLEISLVTSGITLQRLSGTPHFVVDAVASTIGNSSVGAVDPVGATGESTLDPFLGTAAGSVRLIGTFNSVQFGVSHAPGAVEGTGSDLVEIGFTIGTAPEIDLDSTDGSVATSHGLTYLTNAAPVSVASANTAIADSTSTTLSSATVGLTNAEAGDALAIGGVIVSDGSGGTISGTSIAYLVSNDGNTITLSGVESIADYQTAIEEIGFASTSDNNGDRTIEIQVVDDDGYSSNIASSTITVELDKDADGVPDTLDIDDDNDGILDIEEGLTTTASVDGVTSQIVPSTGTTLTQKSGVIGSVGFANTPSAQSGTVTLTDVREFEGDGIGLGRITFFSNPQVPAGEILGDVFVELNEVAETTLDDSQVVGSRFRIIDFDAEIFTFQLQLFDIDGAILTNLSDVSISVRSGAGSLTAATDLGGGVFEFSVTGPGAVPASNHNTNIEIATTDGLVLSGLRFTATDNPFFGGERLRFLAFRDVETYTGRDTDGDGILDHRDIDSDNDGITDNVEAQTTADYVTPSGIDLNNDGLDDAYDNRTVLATSAAATQSEVDVPTDTENDGIADYLDTDSDNDGVSDAVEAGHGETLASIAASADSDGDGLADVVDQDGAATVMTWDPNDDDVDGLGEQILQDSDADLIADRTNADPLNIDFDFREATDTDGDNVHDAQDVDDDNDGILDTEEGLLEFQMTFNAGTEGWRQDNNNSNAGFSNVGHSTDPLTTGGFDNIDQIPDSPSGTPFILSDDLGGGSNWFESPDGLGLDLSAAEGGTFSFYWLNQTYDGTGSQSGTQFSVNLVGTSTTISVDIPVSGLINTGWNLLSVDLDDASWSGTSADLRAVLSDLQRIELEVESISNRDLEGSGSSNNAEYYAIDDITFTNSRDTDGDGVADHLDIDSDNDGITDNVEAQTTADYIAPSGTGSGITDINNDGLDDNYDTRGGALSTSSAAATSGAGNGEGLTPTDADGDGTVDTRDLDSDNDQFADYEERGDGQATSVTSSVDTDGDGLLDIFEGSDVDDGFDVNDENRTASTINLAGDRQLAVDGGNAIALVRDSNFRDNDYDNDGVADELDIDDDNDGILDVNEGLSGTLFSTLDQPTPTGTTSIDSATGLPNGPAPEGTWEVLLFGGHFGIAGSATATTPLAEDGTAGQATLYGQGYTDYAEPSYFIDDREILVTESPADSIIASETNFVHNPMTGAYDPNDPAINRSAAYSIFYRRTMTQSGTVLVGQTGDYIDGYAEVFVNGSRVDSILAPITFLTGADIFEVDVNPGDVVEIRLSNSGGLSGFDVSINSNFEIRSVYDTDGDGIFDHLDLDSDNDGITDNVEGQSTKDYIAPSASGAFVDVDGDGLDDQYDTDTSSADRLTSLASVGIVPVDSDSTFTAPDGIADFRDLDSDDDGISDQEESGLIAAVSTSDTDRDGLLDDYEGTDINDPFDVNDENVNGVGEFTLTDSDNDVVAGRANSIVLDIDYDFREALDTDGDNVHDFVDIDDDNDGILDVIEAPVAEPVSFAADGTFEVLLGAAGAWGTFNGNVTGGGWFNGTGTADSIVPGPNHPASPDGGVFAQAGTWAGGGESLYHDISGLIPDQTYSVTFYHANTGWKSGGNVGVDTAQWEVRLGSEAHRSAPQTFLGAGNQVWEETTLIFTATAETERLEFQAKYISGNIGGTILGVDGIRMATYIDPVSGLDFDGDGIINSLDIDSDNDGITDNVEAQTTADYIPISGTGTSIVDADRDGLDDAYDATPTTGAVGSIGLTPVDTDSSLVSADNAADYLDIDSDNDGISDAEEAGHGETLASIDASSDSDGDGLKDIVDQDANATSATWDPNDDDVTTSGSSPTITVVSNNLADSDNDTSVSGNDAVALISDVDFRDVSEPAVWSINGDLSVTEGAASSYTLSLAGDFLAGKSVSVNLAIVEGTTTAGDHGVLGSASAGLIKDLVDSYNLGSNPGSLLWDGTTLTFISDGTGPMSDLTISIPAIDDTNVEGEENFSIVLSDGTSNSGDPITILNGSVTTTIIDNDSGEWSLVGDTAVNEGGEIDYTLSLAGTFQAGETAVVGIVQTDVDTNALDIGTNGANTGDLHAALVAAAALRSDLDFNVATGELTYAAPSDGASMADLVFSLQAVDDAFIEGDEQLSVGLVAATQPSTTGSAINIDAGNAEVLTTIADTTDVTGVAMDGPVEWSLTGDSAVDEGAVASYTIALSGTYGVGEQVSVTVGLSDGTTNASDIETGGVNKADLNAALAAIAASRLDLTFDSVTGELTFTSQSDGDSMADVVVSLAAANDTLIEGDEVYSVELSPASVPSATGLPVSIAAGADVVDTTIDDTQGPSGPADGPAEWSITGPASSGEGSTAQYTVALSGTFGANEIVSVELNLSDIDTTSSDYGDILAAIQAAADANPHVTFDGVSTLTYTAPSDGASMSDLIIDLPLSDDGLIEGPEDFNLALTNAASSTGANVAIDTANDDVTTTIDDTQGPSGPADGPAEWSITGPASSGEGSTAQYTVALSGTFGANEIVSVELNLSDIDTTSSDYGDILAAIQAAVDATPHVTFDGVSTLTYTAPSDGASMSDLIIDLPLSDDGLIEGPEDFNLALTNAASSTGANVAIDTANDDVTTTIDDTQGPSGPADGPAEWSITGPASSGEGSTAQYTVALSGTFGANEIVSVELNLSDIDTTSSDYGDILAAIQAAVDATPHVTFDGVSTLTYTAPSDGASMSDLIIDLPLSDDGLIEGPEAFRLMLSNPWASGLMDVGVNPSNGVVTTIITDFGLDINSLDARSDGNQDASGGWDIFDTTLPNYEIDTNFGGEEILVAAVNEVEFLNGVGRDITGNNLWPFDSRINADNRRLSLDTSPLELELGSSLQDSNNSFMIDTFEHENQILVCAQHTQEFGAPEVEFIVYGSNGEPLPPWISMSRNGYIVIGTERPADLDSVRMRIIAMYENGKQLERHVEINLRTTLLNDLKDTTPSDPNPSFQSLLQLAHDADQRNQAEMQQVTDWLRESH